MRRMIRMAAVASALLVAAVSLHAQANVAGEWSISFATVSGPMEMTMVLAQDGTKLTGHLTSEIGEFPVKGTIDGDQVRIVWTLNEGGKEIEVTFAARVQGNSMNGTARLSGIGEGAFSADRTDGGD